MIVEPSEVDVDARRARDRALVESHCNGDQDAFASIVSDHYRVLLAQAERRVRSRGEAEDVVQDTFERAFRAICRFGADDEYRLGAWLSRILANVCADREGRLARERGIPERLAVHAVDGTEGFETVSDPAVLRAVHDAIDALPSSQRDTFLLRERDGLSYPQVADRLEISEENARARVHRAKAALQRSLAVSRAAIGSLVAIPVGVRTLFRRGSIEPAASTGAPQLASSSTASTLVAQVAASPVGQTVVALAPSGGLRGSIVAGIAGLAVTGALAVPAVTTSSSSIPSPSVERSGQDVGVLTPPAALVSTPTTLAPPPPTSTSAPSPEPTTLTTMTTAPDHVRADWWNDDSYKAALVDESDEPSVEADPGTAPAAAPSSLCAPNDVGVGAANASGSTRVVSTLELPPAVSLDKTDRGVGFSYTTRLAATNEDLTVAGEVCDLDGTPVLDLRLVATAGSVHLTGQSVYDEGGVWIFRGIAAHEGDGTFAWETGRFIAKFEVGQMSSATLGASLSIAFQADGTHADDGTQDAPTPINVTSPPPGSDADSPGDEHTPTGPIATPDEDPAADPTGASPATGSGDGSSDPSSTPSTITAPPSSAQVGAAA